MVRTISFLVSLNLSLVSLSLLPVSPARRISDAPCPNIVIKCLGGDQCRANRSKLLVEVNGGRAESTPKYTWCLSAGTITSGQGTDTIEIDTSALSDEWITVVIMIGGFDRACSNTATL